MKDICFTTYISDQFFFTKRALMSVNSLMKYHPDIDVYVYRSDYIDKFFTHDNPLAFTTEHTGEERVAWYNLTTETAKNLMKDYKRVVHFDGDVICTGRWDEILEDDWEIGVVSNFNRYENASVGNVTEEMYVQNGICGSSRIEFWNKWQEASKEAHKYTFYDCDTLNLLLYNDPEISKMKIKIFDKDKGYYGCKSLGREHEMYIENDTLMLDGQQVKAYHYARGSNVDKFKFESVGFSHEVCNWLYEVGNKGISYCGRGI